jgi:hypothetical protein
MIIPDWKCVDEGFEVSERQALTALAEAVSRVPRMSTTTPFSPYHLMDGNQEEPKVKCHGKKAIN